MLFVIDTNRNAASYSFFFESELDNAAIKRIVIVASR